MHPTPISTIAHIIYSKERKKERKKDSKVRIRFYSVFTNKCKNFSQLTQPGKTSQIVPRTIGILAPFFIALALVLGIMRVVVMMMMMRVVAKVRGGILSWGSILLVWVAKCTNNNNQHENPKKENLGGNKLHFLRSAACCLIES